MELYIGGFAQGKMEYVKSKYANATWIDESDYKNHLIEECHEGAFTKECCGNKDAEVIIVWNHFHLAMRELLTEGIEPEQIQHAVFLLAEQADKLVVISDEIGNGIVPVDTFERRYREETGRMLIEIAKRANRVERIICGMPQIIKSN